MTSCRHCGTNIDATDTYCSSCGANVQAQSAPPPRITDADAKRIAKANVNEVGNAMGVGMLGIIAIVVWGVVLAGIAILAGIEPVPEVAWTVSIAAIVLGIASTIWIMHKSEQINAVDNAERTREQEPPVDWSGWRK